jgi:hypothetical protein
MISYRSADLKDFEGSNVSRGKFSFDAETLNTSSRRHPKIHKLSYRKL